MKKLLLTLTISSILVLVLVADQYYLTIDNDKPDTKANKLYFQRRFKMKITDDVKNLYCEESFGILDGSQEMTFVCDSQTINKIIKQLGLSQEGNLSNSSFGSLLRKSESEINKLRPFYSKPGSDHYCYYFLWYNKTNKHAFFQSYDT